MRAHIERISTTEHNQVVVADRNISNRTARLSPRAWQGWDELAAAVRSGRPSFAGLTEAIGLYLDEHDGQLWKMTEAQQRELVRRAFDIDAERRERGRRPR